MSDRRRRSHEDYRSERIIIEREPQLYNLFRSRRKSIHIIEEVPVRSRQRRSLTPPSSPPRTYHTMAANPEDDLYTPLPPKLPKKEKRREDEPQRYNLVERSPQRYRKVQIINDRFDDDNAHPRVESASPPRKRDSGKYMSGARGDDIIERVPIEYDRVRPASDPELHRLRDELERLRLETRKSQLAALAATDNAERYKADLDYEKRQRSLEKRERALNDREKWLSQQRERERDQLVEVRRPRERQDVVVVHNPPAAVVARDTNRSALDRARDDYQRGQQAERRPGTAPSRRERIIIVDDEPDHPTQGQRRR